ncbi:MAG: hypothetical protein ACR2NP_03550 [Pirellulaceae bacterium]
MISNMSPRGRNRHASSSRKTTCNANELQFETLEDRRVLASAAFDAGSGMLEINVADDVQTVISHDGQFVTLDGNSDLDPATDGVQQVAVADVVHMNITGSARIHDIPQSLILQGNFDQIHAPNLTSLVVGGLNHVVFDGTYHIGHNLTAGMVNDPLFLLTRITSTPTSQITVEGPSAFFAANGHLNLTEGLIDLRGPLTIWTYSTNTETTIVNQGHLELRHLRIWGNLRLEAPEITDTHDAEISTGGMAHLKADSILLGETVTDRLDFEKLNFKSTGSVNISDDDSMQLVGLNQATSVSLVAVNAINDAIRARTDISGQATFTATHVSLGERESDRFNAGSLSLNVTGHAHVSENSDTLLADKIVTRSLNLHAEGSIRSTETAMVNIAEYLGVQSTGDIELGVYENDEFRSGTLYFGAPDGRVSIHENDDMHLLESKNTARELNLEANGNITDSQYVAINITEGASFAAAGNIMIGDGKRDQFRAGSVTFNSENEVLILQNSDILVTNSNSAGLLTLEAEGEVRDGDGSETSVLGSANLTGDSIMFGHHGTFTSGLLTLNAVGDATVHQGGDLMLDQDSRANLFHLSADGSIGNVPGSSILSTGMLDLAASSIQLGLFDDDMVSSGSMQFHSQGDTRITTNNNILLSSNSFARAYELISTGNIEDEPNAEVVADVFASVEGVDIILGEQNTDCFTVNSSNISILASGVEDVTLDNCVP